MSAICIKFWLSKLNVGQIYCVHGVLLVISWQLKYFHLTTHMYIPCTIHTHAQHTATQTDRQTDTHTHVHIHTTQKTTDAGSTPSKKHNFSDVLISLWLSYNGSWWKARLLSHWQLATHQLSSLHREAKEKPLLMLCGQGAHTISLTLHHTQSTQNEITVLIGYYFKTFL